MGNRKADEFGAQAMGVHELEAALSDLFHLAQEADQEERRYQAWCEEHPVITQLLGYVRVIPHPILRTCRGNGTDEDYIPDLMGQLANGLWEIIEIKRADTDVLKPGARRQHFYQTFQSYISQCREYSAYFEDFAQRSAFEARYGTEVQTRVKCILVAGLDDEDRTTVHDLIAREPLLEYLTYTELFSKLGANWRIVEGEHEGLPGISFHARVILPRVPVEGERIWIVDFE